MRPDISVVIPTRGRPEKLARAIASLTEAEGVCIEIVVAIDEDDAWLADYQAIAMPAGVVMICVPRPNTLGEKWNLLAAAATGNIIFPWADDVEIARRDRSMWALNLGDAVATLPGALGFVSPKNEAEPGGIPPCFAMSRRTYEIVGMFAPTWFPYWFVDTWWFEVGHMARMNATCDFTIVPMDNERGKTQGMADLALWCRLFEATRQMRRDQAIALIDALMVDMSANCAARTAHHADPAFLAHWGATGEGDLPAFYPAVKAAGEKMLRELSCAF